MIQDQEEYFERLENAPTPEEIRENYIEEATNTREAILDFRKRLGNSLRKRAIQRTNPLPNAQETQQEVVENISNNLEEISEKFAYITSQFSETSVKTENLMDIFTKGLK